MKAERTTEDEPGTSVLACGYQAPTVLWEQPFVALASCSANPCDCLPPPDECFGGG